MSKPFCAFHSDSVAKAIGGRCGHFLCEYCLDVPQAYCCRECREKLVNKETHEASPWLIATACIVGGLVILGLKSVVLLVAFSGLVIVVFFAWLRTARVPLGPAGLNSVDEELDGERIEPGQGEQAGTVFSEKQHQGSKAEADTKLADRPRSGRDSG